MPVAAMKARLPAKIGVMVEFGAAAEIAAVAEGREAERAGKKSEEADLRRKVAEMRGRHLRRYGDGREAHAGDEIGGKKTRFVATE